MNTILCIEDEADIRENLAEELADEGYQAYVACDGRQGLEMIIEHEPDLVLCDISMPRMNGFQLLEEIRRIYPKFAELPFIFLTALADRSQVQAGLDCGADGYLIKPLDFEMLLMTVQSNLRQADPG